MKNILVPILAIVWMMVACTEVPIALNTGETEQNTSELELQKQNILIEEYTGVTCVNCPDGTKAIEKLVDRHGDRLIPLAIHAGFYAKIIPGKSTNDLKCEDGIALVGDVLGEPSGYPSASINRIEYDATDGIHVTQPDWAQYVSEELNSVPLVGMDIKTSIDGRRLTIDVRMLKKGNLRDDVRLSLFVAESGVLDAQKTRDDNFPDGVDVAYEHNHLLRDMITSFRGDLVTTDLVENDIITKQYVYDVDPQWDIAQLDIVGAVHEGGQFKRIYQAYSHPLKN